MVFADEWLRSPKWKLNEYKAADLLGGKRRPQRKFRKQGADVRLDVADVEVKTRKLLPKWLCSALAKYSDKTDRLAAVLWLQNNQQPDQGLIVMSVPQFQMLLKLYRSWRLSQESASTPMENAKSDLKASI